MFIMYQGGRAALNVDNTTQIYVEDYYSSGSFRLYAYASGVDDVLLATFPAEQDARDELYNILLAIAHHEEIYSIGSWIRYPGTAKSLDD